MNNGSTITSLCLLPSKKRHAVELMVLEVGQAGGRKGRLQEAHTGKMAFCLGEHHQRITTAVCFISKVFPNQP
ncbi:hypothetical protein ATANTOWER_018660 [Ataeniobius toweri]|uniref:Uncharacterized protein n=1 Tax=Ataeniobius toweri TaxID=208326 RepID=A0ABU7B8B3_9TELE|nr:hypothetical protein [Ataeniobius toweri]